jgi:hypothetical protein
MPRIKGKAYIATHLYHTMDINAEANYIRQQLEHRNITTKEAREMLDRLDNRAVLEALDEPTYIPPPIVR